MEQVASGVSGVDIGRKVSLHKINGLVLISSCKSRQTGTRRFPRRNSLLFFKKFPVSREFGGRLRKGERSTRFDAVRSGSAADRSRARDVGWLQIACKCSQAGM